MPAMCCERNWDLSHLGPEEGASRVFPEVPFGHSTVKTAMEIISITPDGGYAFVGNMVTCFLIVKINQR